MSSHPYLISNIRIGLERDLEPWLLPQDAFPTLEDCYLFRGRIPRRKGFQDLGRIVSEVLSETVGTVTTPWTSFTGFLSRQIGTLTTPWNTFSTTLPNIPIEEGSLTVTIGAIILTDDGEGNLNTSPVSLNTGTINYTSGSLLITINPALAVDTPVYANYNNTDISPGSITLTVGALIFTDNGNFGSQTGTLNTSPTSNNTGTINYITGEVTLNFDPSLGIDTPVTADYEYYNNLPVMGLRTRELTSINQEQLIGFDEIKANVFSTSNKKFQDISYHTLPSTDSFSWTGSDSDFFYTTNYANGFWVTNGTKGFQDTWNMTVIGKGDGIRWYDASHWGNFLPQVDTTNYLMGATLIFPYRGRLVVLNTQEGTSYGSSTSYPQRARWSQNGTPYVKTDPLGNTVSNPGGVTGDDSSWRSDQAGKGGFIDAPTQEAIISAEFYKDTLIVFFERSTWQLRYTGNSLLPFLWERISIELGAESTFSLVPFESGMVAVGNYGIMQCDGTGVHRIDQIIPDEIFSIHNGNEGVKRVYGIRDYVKQLVYWTFPSFSNNTTYPNRILVYNYLDGSYSFFNDSFTCFGQYQPFNDIAWEDLPFQWGEYPYAWNDAKFQSGYPSIVAGNQQGFVFKDINNGPIINDYSLIITGITQADPCVITSSNHNLTEGNFIKINNVQGMTELNENIYRVTNVSTNSFSIQTLEDDNFITVDSTSFNAYTSGGRIIFRNNFSIITKRFNPFLEKGDQVRLQQCDYFLDASSDTEFSIQVFLDENSNNSVETDLLVPSSSLLGKVWVRAFFSVIGQFVQMELSFSDSQMFNENSSNGDFTLHAIMPWMSSGGRLTYGNTR